MGTEFDAIKWARQDRFRTMDGRRAHTAMDPETGATILVTESDADAAAYETTRAALARSVAWVEVNSTLEAPEAPAVREVMRPTVPTCEGCGAALNPAEALHWSVCMPCTRARHRAAVTHRCTCPKSAKRPKRCQTGSRVWESCLRCLGSIRQLS